MDVKDLERFAWPTPDLWDYSQIQIDCRNYADYWIGGHSRGIFEISWFLRGFENFLLDLAAEPVLADAVMDRVEEYLWERTRRILDAGKGLMDMMEYNDDVGSQKGMLMSPDLWRKRIKPRMRRFIELCKGYGVRVRYHSCGSIRPIIPDLIEIGVDVLNPIQTAAVDMDLVSLKREFGRDLTFNGGIDTEQIYRHVRQVLQEVAEDGGYILAPSHVFQPDVPLENVLAVYDAAR
jgi:uroporphyrinogen decarboxylase